MTSAQIINETKKYSVGDEVAYTTPDHHETDTYMVIHVADDYVVIDNPRRTLRLRHLAQFNALGIVGEGG